MNRVLLNTLYVMSRGGGYLRLKNDTIRIEQQGECKGHVPLHHLSGVVVSEDTLLSSALLGECARRAIGVSWLDWNGRFMASLRAPVQGNVLLRLAQYRLYDNPDTRLDIAKELILAKLQNSRHTLTRRAREAKQPEQARLLRDLKKKIDLLKQGLHQCATTDEVRGVEGICAQHYFQGFDAMVAGSGFLFEKRTRRPPRNAYNALLSFLYTVLVHDCVSACEGVGLDPQLGFLHEPRPGRPSCALDLAEEFRGSLVDRLVFTLINRGQLHSRESGG